MFYHLFTYPLNGIFVHVIGFYVINLIEFPFTAKTYFSLDIYIVEHHIVWVRIEGHRFVIAFISDGVKGESSPIFDH